MARKKTPPKRRPGRPSTGITPLRPIRMKDELWQQVQAAAEDAGMSASAFVIRAIEKALKR